MSQLCNGLAGMSDAIIKQNILSDAPQTIIESEDQTVLGVLQLTI